MSDDYEDYERECKIIKKENKELLDKFYDWLKAKKLKKTTCNNHCRNIDFYINDFLVYEAPTRPHEGVYEIGMFLGYWFIRKAMWASQSTIKQNAASLKKFPDTGWNATAQARTFCSRVMYAFIFTDFLDFQET